MKAALSLFRIRFLNSLQYRTAAIAGMATQFVWGGMLILLYKALNESNPAALPMELPALCGYVWLQQAFLALFNVWTMEKDLLNMVYDGSVGYELCRPMDIYTNWYIKSLSTRVARAVLRCMPVLILAFALPAPYGLTLPKDPVVFLAFVVSAFLGALAVVSFIMLIYISAFFTLNAKGFRSLLVTVADFLAGQVIPLPFFPEKIRNIVELLPFAAMQNTPLLIYVGDVTGNEIWQTILLQLFWLLVMTVGGKFLMNKALRNVVVQGG